MSVNCKTKNQYVGFLHGNRYIARAERYSKISTDNVLKYASQSAGVPEATVRACALAMVNAVAYFVCNGHSVQLGRFGSLAPRVKAKTTESKEMCSKQLIKSLRLSYRPSTELQEIVNNVTLTNTVKQ